MTALLASCNKWLDVKPEAESTKEELFSTEKGFRDALTGAYLDMKNTNTYGGSLVWGNIEYLAHNWDVATPSDQLHNSLVSGDYNNAAARGALDATYAGLYKVIADVNGILGEIDPKASLFTEDNYALIKGEALGLRAFMHFDALRLFGPMPDSGSVKPVLAYMKTVSHDITEPESYDAFCKDILADLTTAATLMQGVDPVTKYSMSQLNPTSANSSTTPVIADNFYMHRQVRMNYYAVLALTARVYLWMAAKDPSLKAEAARYAKMVVDAKDQNGVPTFRLVNENDRVNGDYTMSPEHIMALSVYDLDQQATDLFGETGSLQRSDFSIEAGYYYLNFLFPVTERTGDVRWNGMWQYKAANPSYVRYNKYVQRASNPVQQVPLIRLSELYLILTETASSKAEAETYYSAYAAEKGIPFNEGFSQDDYQSDRRSRLIREYAREFFAEGQSFFTYKRMDVTTLPAGWTANYFTGSAARYVVPLPDREISYHNK